MTAKPGCHNDSLWKEEEWGEEDREEGAGRATDVSLAPPTDIEIADPSQVRA